MRNLSKDAHLLGQVFGFAFSLCLFSAVHAEPVDLKAQMSAEQYRASGLHQLTDAQRAALQGWLAEHAVRSPSLGVSAGTDAKADTEPKRPTLVQQEETQLPLPAPNRAESMARGKPSNLDKFGNEQVQKKVAKPPEVVDAQIAGDFRGWDGKTLFRLTNGQVWRQRVGGRYRYRAVDPAVRIQRARFGYYLEVVATGRKVGIKRVK